MVGTFKGLIDFDPGSGIEERDAGDNFNTFLLKVAYQ
jgi:hypothetical protein